MGKAYGFFNCNQPKALVAQYHSATHVQTADEVATVLNQAYNSDLYQNGEPFVGQIVYQSGNKYVFRD